MPVAADLVLYAAASQPDTDAGVSGGAIDLLRYADFTQIAANDTIEAISDGADTRNLTIEARTASGTIVSETKALTGATLISFSTLGTVERILKAELASGDAARTVTVRRTTGATLIRALGPNKRGFLALFRKAASDPAAVKNYYTKAFWKNENATTAALGLLVKQNADPDARITHLLAATANDVATSTNRITAPAVADTQDPDTFDDLDKACPGTDLAATAAIGVWFRLQLPAADAAHKTNYVSEVAFTSV